MFESVYIFHTQDRTIHKIAKERVLWKYSISSKNELHVLSARLSAFNWTKVIEQLIAVLTQS